MAKIEINDIKNKEVRSRMVYEEKQKKQRAKRERVLKRRREREILGDRVRTSTHPPTLVR